MEIPFQINPDKTPICWLSSFLGCDWKMANKSCVNNLPLCTCGRGTFTQWMARQTQAEWIVFICAP